MENPRITVKRFPSEDDWTLSEFFIDGVKKGVGVEDEKRDVKVKGETRIPAGIYELGLRQSPKFSKAYYVDKDGNLSQVKSDRFARLHDLIWVKNVPDFEYILWHWGNTDDDTDGCYIVGTNTDTFNGQKGVGGSRAKYAEIYPIIWNMIKASEELGKKVYVEYID